MGDKAYDETLARSYPIASAPCSDLSEKTENCLVRINISTCKGSPGIGSPDLYMEQVELSAHCEEGGPRPFL